MNWVNVLRRWTMRSIHAAILGAALLGSASAAFAQTTPAASTSQVQKHYTKTRSFDLPVRMDPEFRQTLKEIRLYTKTPTGSWTLQETGAPNLERFACKVSQDGEYWYTLMTVDKSGRTTPESLEPVSQRVVVDTTPPQIQVQPTALPDGDYALRCTVQDANPDVNSLTAVCRTETGDMPLMMVPGQPGVFRVKGGEMLRHPVFVVAKDMAKNESVQPVNLRDMLSSTLAQPPAPMPTPSRLPGDISQTVSRPDFKGTTSIENPGRGEQPRLPINNRVDFPPPPVGSPPPLPGESPLKIGNNDPIKPLQTESPTTVSGAPAKTGGVSQLINTTTASIDYKISNVGPSGVGKVEVYITPDNGQTWHRLAEDTMKRPPVNVKLPGDGVYGIHIAVTNGNGFGGKAPARGDAPHYTIEVDTTSPFVQFRSTEVMPGANHVEIRWNANDKNLGSAPVTIHYRTRPDGPWQVVAANVKNDGMYRWAFPRDAGGQFYFKVEVTDQAGNVAHATSPQPILIDMSEPRATIVGVTGGR
ncbi:MAG TPA: hypothetical protein VFE62_22075 [Gemmataceae bacterium]|nr:hypothetical protein [Gemmataceae bacterium]